MMKNGCEAGCKIFTGGEIKHHPDCQYYAESMSKLYDDLQSEVKKLRLQNVTQRSEPLINSDFAKHLALNKAALLFELTNEIERYCELINGG